MESGDADPERHEPRSPEGGPLRRARRAGGGGRWWLWVGRAVLWAFILVVLFNGIRAPLVDALQPDDAAPSPASRTNGYPASAASAYALRFAHVYLDYGEGDPRKRAERLAKYLPEGADPQLGWNGQGTLRFRTAHVAGVDVRDATHGVVTLAVQVSGQWMRLAVPVYAAGDGMVVSGQPALLPSPPQSPLPQSPQGPTDEKVAAELRRQLPGFFQAYAGGGTESLARYLAPGVSLTGFSGAMRFVSLDEVVVPASNAPIRRVTATVTWRLLGKGGAAGGELQQTYQLTVSKDEGRWYVRSIHGAPGGGFS